MRLTPYGRREWMTISVLAIAAAGALAWLGWTWAIVLVAIIWLALAAFFRDPTRHIPDNLAPGDMLSPADGRISKIFRVDHHEATGGPAQVIRIFLSVLDVHVNRSPFDGEVVALNHKPGRYLDARSEKSAELNESNLITIRISHRREVRATADADGQDARVTDIDETIGVRQVSGAIARRIVCPLKIGDRLTRGERFGMIKFGSTTELILPRPDDVTVHVNVGDTVRGGLTVLATLRPAGENMSSAPSHAR